MRRILQRCGEGASTIDGGHYLRETLFSFQRE
jgi:hypothetical protein